MSWALTRLQSQACCSNARFAAGVADSSWHDLHGPMTQDACLIPAGSLARSLLSVGRRGELLLRSDLGMVPTEGVHCLGIEP